MKRSTAAILLSLLFLQAVPVSAKDGKKRRSKQAAPLLINFNFGLDTGLGHGNALLGEPEDHWNFLDVGMTSVEMVKAADGTTTDMEMSFDPNDGKWGITDHQGVYHAYLYHNNRAVDLSCELKYVPPGVWEVFVFAHGDAPDQNAAVDIQCGDVLLTGKATLNDGSWDFRSQEFVENNQYVRYVVDVQPGDVMRITSKRDGSNLSMFNAIQMRRIVAR